MTMIEELTAAITTLNNVESKKSILEKEINDLDDKTQDLLHHLEYNEFSSYYAGKLAFELQDIRRQRRQKKNELELVNCLITHSLKLNNIGNREFIIHSLKKTHRETTTVKWVNRQYKQEDLDLKFITKEDVNDKIEQTI
jgi:hypothetical protein